MLQKFREMMRTTQRGAIMIFFAILLPLFLGMVGFAVDAGLLYMQKAKLQDIADAAALAGAGHLGDKDNRSEKVQKAVEALTNANGLSNITTDGKFLFGDEYPANDSLTLVAAASNSSGEKWKVATKIESNVKDKDNVERDHVRVLVAKRVNTVFIRLLFPGQKDVVVKALAVAEQLQGESLKEPKLYCDELKVSYPNNNNISIAAEQDFSIYADRVSGLSDKFPTGSTGTLYAGNFSDSLPTGWTLVNVAGEPDDKVKQEALVNAKAKKIEKAAQYKKILNDEMQNSNRRKYANSEGKKRLLGFANATNTTEKVVTNNILGTDGGSIDLYMNAMELKYIESTNGKYDEYVVLTNSQLKNVRNINKLILAGDNKKYIISTTGVTYGDIYANGEVSIAGSDNKFTGVIYSTGTLMLSGKSGKKNYFNEGGSTELFAKKIVLGLCKVEKIPGATSQTDEIHYIEDLTANASWRMNWGSTDSDNTLAEKKGRVRLVI